MKNPINPPKMPEIDKPQFKSFPTDKGERDRRVKKEFEEQVVQIDRVARVVAGGKRLRFRAIIVIGNKLGKVGLGVAKANDVVSAVAKAKNSAQKNLIQVPIKNDTIPHEIYQTYGSARVLLKPAAKGTGIIAGGSVRIVASLAGIKNILGKILGSKGKINNLKAVILALTSFIEGKNETR